MSDFYVELDFLAREGHGNLCIGFDMTNSEGVTVFRTYQTDLPLERWPAIKAGRNRWRCRIPKGLLNGGDFFVSPRISIHNVSWIVHEDAALKFRMHLRHGVSPLWDSLNETARPRSGRANLRLEYCGFSLNQKFRRVSAPLALLVDRLRFLKQ